MPAQLSRVDADQFVNLHLKLLYYAVSSQRDDWEIEDFFDYLALPVEAKRKTRKLLIENPSLIDEFVEENPAALAPDELAIVARWKDMVPGKFIVYKKLTHYWVFLDADKDPPRAYGVKALTQPLEAILPFVPYMGVTVLMPYQGQIVYDGIFDGYNISFGRGIRKGFKSAYRKAKHYYGIITALPFDPPEEEPSHEEQLKFYLKTKASRQRYEQEVWELLDSHPELEPLFHQQMGRVHARSQRRALRDIGIERGWFATVDGAIIAGGADEAAVRRAANALLPIERRDHAYIYELK